MWHTNYIHSPTYLYYKKHIEKEYLRIEELRIKTINNGIVLPIRNCNGIRLGGVISECGDYINESAQLASIVAHRANGKYEYNQERLIYSEQKIVYLGTSCHPNHWGHLIVDGFARLWCVNKILLKDYYICFNSNEGKDYKITGNCLKLLQLYGIPAERIVVISQPTQFSSVIVPEPSFAPGIYYHKNHNTVFDMINKNVMVMADGASRYKKYEKIYFSRSKLKQRGEFGCNLLDIFFKKNGFRIIYPEKCTPVEQIFYIQNCTIFASMDGSIAHNLVFAKKGTTVILLCRSLLLNPFQFLINQMRELDVTVVDVHVTPFLTDWGGTALLHYTDELRNFARENNYIIPSLPFYGLRFFTAIVRHTIKYLLTNKYIPVESHTLFMSDSECLELLNKSYIRFITQLHKLLKITQLRKMLRKDNHL